MSLSDEPLGKVEAVGCRHLELTWQPQGWMGQGAEPVPWAVTPRASSAMTVFLKVSMGFVGWREDLSVQNTIFRVQQKPFQNMHWPKGEVPKI